MKKRCKLPVLLIVSLLLIIQISLADNITITNMGVPGLSSTNQEYTSLRTVIIETNYTQNSTCSYSNEDLVFTTPANCTTAKYWLLSTGAGLKTVYATINLTNGTIYDLNDTITYNYTGAGLDTTPPSEVEITANNYSSNDTTISVSWTQSFDPESDILGIPLIYSYQILINGVDNSSWVQAGSEQSATYTTVFSHADNITIIINATNSAMLSSSASKNVTIDLVPPNDTQVSSDLAVAPTWNSAKQVTINWNSTDDLSGVYAYSYTFSTDSSVTPDNVPEGPKDNLSLHTNKTFTGLSTGKYSFRLIARDAAGNYENTSTNHYIWIDATPPTKPVMLSSEQVQGTTTLNFTWSESYDEDSGVEQYEVNILNSTGDLQFSINVTGQNYYEYTPVVEQDYYAIVRGIDFAGNPSYWSNQEGESYDSTAPTLTIIRPRTTIEDGVTPTIALTTDEEAVCYYQVALGDYALFTYTNSTYHETKPDRIETNGYNINCSDIAGNQAPIEPTGAFTQDSSAISISAITSNPTAFTSQIITFSVNISPGKGEAAKERFKLYLNNTETDFIITDNGAGEYMLSFQAPQISGTYALTLNADSDTDSTTLTVTPLTLTISYQDTFSSFINTRKMTYYDSGNKDVGLSTDSTYLLLETINDELKINAQNDGKTYIFATKKIQNTEMKDRDLASKSFQTQKTPSFGYAQSQYNMLSEVLRYNHINIDADSEELSTGSHNILIKRLQNQDGKKTVLVTTDISSYNDKGVVQYDK